VLERAVVLARSDTLGPELLPPQLAARGGRDREAEQGAETAPAESGASLEQAEREALVQALEANDHHRQRTADALGVSRRTLQYKLKKHGLAGR
jgi:DNA-binding NtrC family response regulator